MRRVQQWLDLIFAGLCAFFVPFYIGRHTAHMTVKAVIGLTLLGVVIFFLALVLTDAYWFRRELRKWIRETRGGNRSCDI